MLAIDGFLVGGQFLCKLCLLEFGFFDSRSYGVGINAQGQWIDAHPKSLLKEKLGPDDVALIESSDHAQNFIDAVKSRRPAISNLPDAVRSDVISHLCDIAIRTGRKIAWDPSQETIVGDAAAVKMLNRPMRPPWKI